VATEEYKNPVNVQVCLVTFPPGGSKSISIPCSGVMYDETKLGLPYQRCVAVSGIEDAQLPKDEDNCLQLRDWVRNASLVVLYPTDGSDPGALDTKGTMVGLTSTTGGTDTKGIPSLKALPVAALTAAEIKALGF